MKSKDISLIVIIAIFAGAIAFAVSSMFLSTPENLQQKVEVVEPISAEFPSEDKRYFNGSSINPTRLIDIDNNENETPFE